MTRRILPVLLLLLAAPQAHAVPITQFAIGTITRNLSVDAIGPVHPYIFATGEVVSLKVVADPDRPYIDPDIRIDLETVGGFHRAFIAKYGTTLADDGVLTYIRPSMDPWEIIADFGAGTLRYESDLGIGSEGFAATLCRPEAVPEPATIVMALLGAAMVILWTSTGLVGAVLAQRWRAGR